MSVRGPRGGRGRGRGGKTTIWTWESYTPGPEVYEQLWHIRKEPVVITSHPPSECPIPNAQTRILDRRQTEGDISRNFYIVEIAHPSPSTVHINEENQQDLDATGSHSEVVEIIHVDLSRILEYVSAHELERFENEQFRIEAEAEAVALRAEAEAAMRKRLQKNERTALANGDGHIPGDGVIRSRGRPRGRGRGRGRGRPSWRGRGALVLEPRPHETDLQDEPVSEVPDDISEDELATDLRRVIPDSATEESDSMPEHGPLSVSPGIARSAFVTNSALPTSPSMSYRRMSGGLSLKHDRVEDSGEESGLELIEEDSDHHRGKRRMTESSVSTNATHQPRKLALDAETVEYDNINVQEPAKAPLPTFSVETESEDADDEDAEEYVVEAILEHYYDEEGTKFYLVKWAGYEDSHDWLPEGDLEGAAELVTEYNRGSGKSKKKVR